MKSIIALVIGVLVLAVAWFLASPLFIDRSVDEAFELVLDDGSVNVEAVLAMPEEKRLGMMDEIMEAAEAAPDKTMDESMMPDEPVLGASGQFRDADAVHKGSGNALLYTLPDGRHVLRFEEFRTTNGPDLVVYLAKHPSPASADDVTDGGYLSLGKLKGNVGNQNYVLPENVAIEDYQSVVIWCELFGVLFSPAPLMPGTAETSDEGAADG